MNKPTNRIAGLGIGFCLIALFCFGTYLNAQLTDPVWVSDINGIGDFSDRFTCIQQDNSGNYIAAGSSVNRSTNKDFLVVKFNAAGDTIWSFVLDGGFEGPDEIVALILDNAGNIYAAGFMKGYYTGYDLRLLKLNTVGDTVWTRKYNYSPANEDDIPTSIALDNSGNIVVGGYSDSDPSSFVANDDALLLKYSSSGSLLWTQRFNGTLNGIDRFAKILVNSAGDIYAGGRTDNGDDDFLLVKYSSAGSQTWLQAFDGGSFDRITCMGLDASGNCIVSGRSSNGTDHDLVTIKYSSTGQNMATASYDYVGDDRATALTVDASGNVYVTGQSDGDVSVNKIFDYVTLKYNSALVQQWATRYAGSAGGDDIPQAIAVTATGEVWITGQSDAAAGAAVLNNCVTIKYSASGAELVAATEGLATSEDGGLGLIIDSGGKTVVCGYKGTNSNQPDATLFRYTASGSKELERFYSGEGDNQDVINAMALASDGSIVSVGYSVEKDLDPNMLFIKTNSSGTEVWRKTLSGNSSTGSTDNATAVVTDQTGAIYATGYTKNSNAGSDFTTVKLNAAGDTIWTRKYSFQTGSSDRAVSLAFDPQGNIVVTGYSDSDPSALTNYDFATIKYTPAGVQLWAVRYNSTFNADDKPVALYVSNAGNIYISGRAFNGSNDDILTVKYNANGVFQWVNVYAGDAGDDRNVALRADAGENLYIAGRTFNGTDLDALLIKVSNAGQFAWNKTFNNIGISDDRFNDLVFDTIGNVIAVGQTDLDATNLMLLNTLAVAYAPDGSELWNQIVAIPGTNQNSANVIRSNNADGFYIGGSATNNQGNSVPLTFKLDPTAGALWYGHTPITNTSQGEIHDMLLSANAIYAGGELELNTSSMTNAILYKYAEQVTSTESASENTYVRLFPNPASGTIYIESLNGKAVQNVAIKDLAGRTIRNEVFSNNTGLQQIDTDMLQSGIYWFEVTQGNQTTLIPVFLN